ncbi:hypothetical protein KDW54_06675 [Burkholderia ambifaria]|uniref:glycine-rich domain-containing protein n=1 Tax=Burkholderia ambifaria TaxID=152480 RepID=UPI001B9102EB|nr:hypothetical protein [Burkholderia ambifaria]MBR8182082.1 hypothetical protein [Burkholderia ambifaria]
MINYVGQVPLDTDLLSSNKNVLTAIGHVLQDMLGTSTLFSGLGCVPTSPAGMTVNVNPGRAYSLQAIDAGSYGSLGADAHQIVKQGILLDAVNFSCPAPTTAGFSINYLVQGAFQEVDTGSVVLPYYNASNPAQAYNGPNGTGTSQATARDNTVQLSLKIGVAATTGSQITPTPDAGFNGLWVITVPYGATTITSGNIAQYAGAPILPSSLLTSIQGGNLSYAVATGTANAHVVTLTPALTSRVDGMVIRYKAPAANTGALTLDDGLGAVAVVGGAHAALQGGETVTSGDVWVQWNSSIGGGSYIMLDSSGGAVQIAPATQSQHALQKQQKGIQAFTSSGSFTVPAGVTTIAVSGCAAGSGGGGGGGSTNVTGTGAGGAGGSAGQSIQKVNYTVIPGSAITITIGAAGSGGSAGTSTANGGNSTAGGNTVISGAGFNGGTAVTLTGGGASAGGAYFSNAGVPTGGVPSATGYPQGSCGADGASGFNGNGIGGMGASCPFGGGGGSGRAGSTGVSGLAAYGYGSGGGGGGGGYGLSTGGSNGGPGGNGMPGYVLIEW